MLYYKSIHFVFFSAVGFAKLTSPLFLPPAGADGKKKIVCSGESSQLRLTLMPMSKAAVDCSNCS